MAKTGGNVRWKLTVPCHHLSFHSAHNPMNIHSWQERYSLFSRLALKIIVIIAISVLLIQLAFIQHIEQRVYERELTNVVEQQATFTEASAIYIAELVSERNEDNLYLVLSTIVANPLIIASELQFTDGRDKIAVGADPTSLVYEFDIKDLDNNDNLVQIGTLVTYATTEFIDEVRNERFSAIVKLVLLVFLVVLAVSTIAVQAFVGIPLKRITNAIATDTRVPDINWNTSDEMGAVVTRLNYLHTRLNNQLTGLEQEINEKERLEAARISSLANASLEGILIFKGDSIIDLNEPMTDLFGLTREVLIGKTVSSLVDSEILDFLQQPITDDIRPVIATTLTNESGTTIPVEFYLHQLEDHGEGNKVAVVRDISERVTAEKEMWQLAHFDSLTGLPNRRYFSEILDRAILRAQEKNLPISVAYLDLDNFKFINDSRGHSAGDQLLSAVADSIRTTLNSTEHCARLGGDEFAILFDESSVGLTVEEHLNNIVLEITQGTRCKPWQKIFSVSIGVATLKGHSIEKSKLLTRADLALYNAKETGRAKICFFSDQLNSKLKRERTIVEKLKTAIEHNLLELYYQPQVLCDGRTITGFEALLRWNDSELGQVSPTEIIEVAEQEGLVSQLGRWVMAKACHDALMWPDNIRLAVNLSPLELDNETLPNSIANCLRESGLPASKLEIEITETALIADTGKAAMLLSTLKSMGITIALDDFGTGYSSLSMLQKFQFDRIKIDRSFVTNISADKDRASIVASTIDLGERLGLDVIAEGVETESDMITLRQFNCRECQGYLISPPIPVNKLTDVIYRHQNPGTDNVVVGPGKWKKAS